MHCPKCSSEKKVKNGFVKGKQRYLCKECGCNYTKSNRHHYPEEERKKVIELHSEGLGFRAIERVTGISNVTAMNWVHELGDKIQENRKKNRKD